MIKRIKIKNGGFILTSYIQLVILMLVIRWQPWGNRLLLPSVCILIIPVTVIISNVIDEKICAIICIALIILSLPVYFNVTRRAGKVIFGINKYDTFYYISGTRKYIPQMEQEIEDNGYKNIGLLQSTADNYDTYPWCKLIMKDNRRIEYVIEGKEERDFVPDVVFSINSKENKYSNCFIYNGIKYECIKTYDGSGYAMYTKSE